MILPFLLTFFFPLISFATALRGSTPFSEFIVVEDLDTIPKGWHSLGSASRESRLHLRIALAQPSQAAIEQAILDISTPSHDKYGKHLDRDELKNLIKPYPEATEVVLNWLDSKGILPQDIENDGEWIIFNATVQQTEALLNAEFKQYENTERKAFRKIRTLRYSVPLEIRPHIDMIQPTTVFAQFRPDNDPTPLSLIDWEPNTNANLTRCNVTITPPCLRELYNITTKDTHSSNSTNDFLGVTGYLEQYARYEDLASFMRQYAPYALGDNFTWVSVNGGTLDQGSQSSAQEANLDIQYAMSMSHPISSVFYSTKGRAPFVPNLDHPMPDDNYNEPFLDFLIHMLKLPNKELPATLTTSYGEDEQSVPPQYAHHVCNLLGQLGARGVSVIFSSGDNGVGAGCQSNDGAKKTRFLPRFPASCPWVTAIGATEHVEPESAAAYSSGGFSNLFPRPSWQEYAVSNYLDILGDRWDGLFNRSGRAFPDVAAQGSNALMIHKGKKMVQSGTSVSAPVFAGIIALLNNARLQRGQPPLGFLNPWIYAEGYKAFSDIVTGGSTGCTGIDQHSGLNGSFIPYASWNATKGWDPVTGYGTPDFGKLLDMTKALHKVSLVIPGKSQSLYNCFESVLDFLSPSRKMQAFRKRNLGVSGKY